MLLISLLTLLNGLIFFIILISIFVFLTDKEEWGGDCETGTKQSPVDLNEDAAVLGTYPPFHFSSGYYQHMVDAAVINTGHSSEYIIMKLYVFKN